MAIPHEDTLSSPSFATLSHLPAFRLLSVLFLVPVQTPVPLTPLDLEDFLRRRPSRGELGCTLRMPPPQETSHPRSLQKHDRSSSLPLPPPTPKHWTTGGFTECFCCYFLLKAGETPGTLHILAQAGTGRAPSSSVPPPRRNSSWRVRMRSVTPTAASSCSLVSDLGNSRAPVPDASLSPQALG